MDIFFTSGDWVAKEGHQEKFIEAFRASAAMEPAPAGLLKPPQVFQDVEEPLHYRSYAEWDSLETINEVRSRPEFPTMLQAMRDHLDDFTIFTGKRIADD